jgi:hypothetical protein
MPQAALRGALAVVLMASGVALSSKAGWGPSLVSLAACSIPSVGLAVVLVRRRFRLPATVSEPVSERA